MPTDLVTTTMRIDRATLERLDAWAEAHGVTRSAAWHVLLVAALDAPPQMIERGLSTLTTSRASGEEE